jgi:hypothetical protein
MAKVTTQLPPKPPADDGDDDMPNESTLPVNATVTQGTSSPAVVEQASESVKNQQKFRNGIKCIKCGVTKTPVRVGEKKNIRVYDCRHCGYRQVVTYQVSDNPALDGWPVDARKGGPLKIDEHKARPFKMQTDRHLLFPRYLPNLDIKAPPVAETKKG